MQSFTLTTYARGPIGLTVVRELGFGAVSDLAANKRAGVETPRLAPGQIAVLREYGGRQLAVFNPN